MSVILRLTEYAVAVGCVVFAGWLVSKVMTSRNRYDDRRALRNVMDHNTALWTQLTASERRAHSLEQALRHLAHWRGSEGVRGRDAQSMRLYARSALDRRGDT